MVGTDIMDWATYGSVRCGKRWVVGDSCWIDRNWMSEIVNDVETV